VSKPEGSQILKALRWQPGWSWELTALLLLGLLSGLSGSPPAAAARAGSVSREGAELFQFPDQSSIAMIHLHKDTRLVASNVPVRGFHRVRLKSSLVGWVAAKDLILQPPPAGFLTEVRSGSSGAGGAAGSKPSSVSLEGSSRAVSGASDSALEEPPPENQKEHP
jgi:hypothetical protein